MARRGGAAWDAFTPDEISTIGAFVRPLLMTALTSFIGHLPMLFATGSGADI